MNKQNNKVLLFIGSLQIGGAEQQWRLTAETLIAHGHDVLLVVIEPGGALWDHAQANLGDRLVSLYPGRKTGKMHRLVRLLGASRRFRHLINREEPDFVVSALYISNLIAFFGCRSSRPKPGLIWSIRGMASSRNWKRDICRIACRWLSSRVDHISSNSLAALNWHAEKGFDTSRSSVIFNIVDTDRFSRNPRARSVFREIHGLEEEAFVVGTLGRLDPIKDHETLIAAFARFAANVPEARLVIVGAGSPVRTSTLRSYASELGISEKVTFGQATTEVQNIYPAFDIFCLSSKSESFPNTLVEAMASGCTCISTDVGDVKHILNDPLAIVPVGNVEQLSNALLLKWNSRKTNNFDQGIRNQKRSHLLFNKDVFKKNFFATIESINPR